MTRKAVTKTVRSSEVDRRALQSTEKHIFETSTTVCCVVFMDLLQGGRSPAVLQVPPDTTSSSSIGTHSTG